MRVIFFCVCGPGSSVGIAISSVGIAISSVGIAISSVGIAIDYGLDGPGIEFRWGGEFPPVQTGPGACPASYTMGTGSSPGVEAADAWG